MKELEPYYRLSNAVIEQAVKDYRMALRGYGTSGKSPEGIITDCEAFFRSELFMLMTNVDGETIIELVHKRMNK